MSSQLTKANNSLFSLIPSGIIEVNLKKKGYLKSYLYLLTIVVLTVLLSYLISNSGIFGASAILVIIIAIPVMFSILFNLEFGILLILVLSFFVLGVKRLTEGIPLGLAMDIIIALMAFGLLIKQINDHDWKFAKNPISYMMLVWILYNIIEFMNPAAESKLAWLYTIRSMAGIMILYFIVLYTLNSEKFISLIIKLWIILASLGAIYGIYQEIFGFLPFELNWINGDIRRYNLLYIWGRFRKFSFFSDPMVFGFVMAYSSLLVIILFNGKFRFRTRLLLIISFVLMITAMLFSGTRAAYAIIPAGLFFYALLNINRKVITGTIIVFILGLAFINMPTSNPTIVRFQSAFSPSNDESYKVRARNQAFIQPYIQKHPLGGGLGSTGVWGERFSPHSPLAKFPPDSGFMRIAVEMGWIGLIIFLVLLFTVFYKGIKEYHSLTDKKLKIISAALLTFLFALVIGNFPQEAIIQYPTSILFYTSIAILTKIKQFDNNSR